MDERPSTSTPREQRGLPERPQQIFNAHFHGNVQAGVVNTGQADIVYNAWPSNGRNPGNQTGADCLELKQKLWAHARRECLIDPVISLNRPIQIAPLQIAERHQDQQSADEFGHFHRRKDLLQLFTNPAVDNVPIEDLFVKAKEFATKSVSNIQHLTNEARDAYTAIHSNIVGLVGQAGIGKTALTKVILKNVVENSLYGAEYVFYLKCRDFDYATKTDLLSLLTPAIALHWKADSNRRNNVINALAQNGNVLVILDGFDEVVKDRTSNTDYRINRHSQAFPLAFINQILGGLIFSKWKKIVTSRPRQLYHLSQDFRPRFILNVLGLTKKAQQQLCNDICEQNSDRIFQYVQSLPGIVAYCYVPVNCILVFYSISKTGINSTLSPTMASIFAHAFALFLSTRHAPRHFQLQKFAVLAYRVFQSDSFYFDETDLEQVGLLGEEQNAFLSNRSKNLVALVTGTPSHVLYFTHLLFEESLVAINLLFFMALSDFTKLFIGTKLFGVLNLTKPAYDLTESRFENIVRFLFGFCNKTTFSYLKETFSFLAFPEQQARLLQQFALDYQPSSHEFNYLEKHLVVFTWVYEMNDSQFTDRFSSRLPDLIRFNSRKILPSDISAIHYVLGARKSPLKFIIYTSQLSQEAFGQFLREMKPMITTSTVVKFSMGAGSDIDLPNCNIGDEELHVALLWLPYFDKISLPNYVLLSHGNEKPENENHFSLSGINMLSAAIAVNKARLRELNLHGVTIGDEGLIAITSCIGRISSLVIGSKIDNRITATGVRALAAAIQALDNPMEYLDMEGVNSGDDGFIAMSSCIKKINSLRIGSTRDSQVTMRGIKALSAAVRSLPRSMSSLRVSCPKIVEDEAVNELRQFYPEIEDLYVNSCFFKEREGLVTVNQGCATS